jgi:hypothetical protein
MKTHVVQDEPDPPRGMAMAASGAEPARTGAAPRPASGGGTGHPVMIVFGALGLLVALALLVSGFAALGALGNRDRDGYFMTSSHRLTTPSAALVTSGIDVDSDVPEWVFGSSFATSRIAVSSARPVFIGIGPSASVDAYLARVRHAQITDVDTDPFTVTSTIAPGRAQAAPPADQDFWRVQSSGAGVRTVTWPLEAGQWSAVMMNADGSPGVAVQARLGAKVPSARWVAYGLLAGGAIALLAGGLLLRRGLTRTSTQRGI